MRLRLLSGTFREKRLVFICTILCMALVSVAPISAQATPINIGENRSGEISAANPAVEFTVTSPDQRSARVQVLAVTAGFAPLFTVIDTTNGVPIMDVGTEGTATIIQGDVTLAAGVNYIIQVQSANGQFGQFVISLQPGPPVQPAAPLTVGQPLSDRASSGSRGRQYSFAADPLEILLLTITSENSTAGPNIVLRDADSGQTLAASGTQLIGVRLRIPGGAGRFVVEVAHGGSAADEAYVICLETESSAHRCPGSDQSTSETATATAAPTEPGFTPAPIPAGGPCALAPGNASAVNVRSAPNTSSTVITQLGANAIVPITGRLADNSWYQVSVAGITGWVSASVSRVGGQCASVTVITLPTATFTPTETSSATPTFTPTVTFTASPSETPSATPTETLTPVPVATLNFSLPAVFGSSVLSSGFVPDPFSVGITGGGPVSVNYLGGSCTGYTTSAPSFSVNYTAGAFPTLRFYFTGSGDTTMIINTPGGSYFCVDDSFGTLNPTIDFNSPSSGRYDVWIGAFNAGASIGGTLYVTESTANRP